jgi:hypothetical protein
VFAELTRNAIGKLGLEDISPTCSDVGVKFGKRKTSNKNQENQPEECTSVISSFVMETPVRNLFSKESDKVF